MSTPFEDNDPKTMLNTVMLEIGSALSSLAMPPRPMPKETLPEDEDYHWLINTDEWCHHAGEHLKQAQRLTRAKDAQLRHLKDTLQNMMIHKTAYNAGTPILVLEDNEWEELWQTIKTI